MHVMARETWTDERLDDTKQSDKSFNALMRTIKIGFSLIGMLLVVLMILISIWL